MTDLSSADQLRIWVDNDDPQAGAMYTASVARARDLISDSHDAGALLRDLGRARDHDISRNQSRVRDRVLARDLARDLALVLDPAGAIVGVAKLDSERAREVGRARDLAASLAVDTDRARDVDRARHLAELTGSIRRDWLAGAGVATGGDETDRLLELADRLASVVYVLVLLASRLDDNTASTAGADAPDPRSQSLARIPTLDGRQAAVYVGAFESAFRAVDEARLDESLSVPFVDPAVEEDLLNLMQQFELAWRRSSVKTQQLELLIVELLELLNGGVEDEAAFREDFVRLGADEALAAVMAHRLAMAIKAMRDDLGGDDPVEAALTVAHVAEAAAEQVADEQSLRERLGESAVDGIGRASGTAAVGGVVTGGVWLAKEYGTRIAREFVIAVGRLYQTFYGG